MNPADQFSKERNERIHSYANKSSMLELSNKWIELSMREKYVYNFEWLGRPIIQYPEDIVAMQELIWTVKPDLIIETGIAHGGSLVFSASMLAMLDYCDAIESGTTLDPKNSHRKVLGLDIDIREHNRAAIESHPMADKIEMLQGSSISTEIINRVHDFSKDYKKILVCLDSNHTYEHVFAELEAYAPLVSPGSYCVVFDTFVEDMPDNLFPDRPWGPGDNPKIAVHDYLKTHENFAIDKSIHNKLMITVAPNGYLKKSV